MRIVLLTLIFLLLTISTVSSHEVNFTETKQLIDSGIGCDKLTDEQLEAIGDYYMEQMHPGEAHEIMHRMMGGEGSASLKQMHIQMARNIYCGENIIMGGMMGINGMMNWMWGSSCWNTLTWLNQILLTIILVLLIVFLYKLITKKK